ncbi:MAG: Uma2 family endonuclease [Myxococcales bacterium]|nr:Uma2 family endonuclease [Myxococcales bacterium]
MVSAPRVEVSPSVEADQRVFMRGVSYKDYELVLLARGEASVPRISYAEGVLELMSPSRSHETLKTLIGRLVEAYAEERGLDLNGFGSWTLKNPAVERGAEPDECYTLGPPGEVPDLALEVAWTHGGLDKLDIYAKLGVGEVWFWRKGRIEIHVLRGEGFEEVERSPLLPDLDLRHLETFLDEDNQTQAVRAYRLALRGGS